MANILNLPNWAILDVEDGDDVVVNAIFSIEPKRCIQCNSEQIVKHGPKWTTYRDAPNYGKPSSIRAQLNRYKCKSCECTFVQPVTGMRSDMRMTERCFKYIQAQSLRDTFTNIAYAVGCNEKTVRSIAHPYLQALSDAYKPRLEGWIGIDETQLDGKMRFIVSDLKNRKPLEMLPDREHHTVSNFMWKHRNANIEVFVMDMWKPYKKIINTVFPGVPIVVDKFHIVRMANQAMDEIRKRVASGKGRATGLDWKRKKVLLRLREHKLDEHGRFNVDMWLDNEPDVAIAYYLKELFYTIYDQKSKEDAIEILDQWLEIVPSNMCKTKLDFKGLKTAATNWRKELLAYFDYPITNGYTEALNGVAKVMNRQGRGYGYDIVRAKLLFKKNVPLLPEQRGQPSQEVIDEIMSRVTRCVSCGGIVPGYSQARIFEVYDKCDACFYGEMEIKH